MESILKFFKILSIILLLSSLIISIYAPKEIKKIDCYDRYGNKILYNVCETEVIENDYNILLNIMLVIGILCVCGTTAYDVKKILEYDFR